MTTQRQGAVETAGAWHWPIDVSVYDRRPTLSAAEARDLDAMVAYRQEKNRLPWQRKYVALQRLVQPIQDVLAVSRAKMSSTRRAVVNKMLRGMQKHRLPFWAWTPAMWVDVIGPDWPTFVKDQPGPKDCRHHLMALAYLLGELNDLHLFGAFAQQAFATRVFGPLLVQRAIERVCQELRRWGYAAYRIDHHIPIAVCEALLANRSPLLEDLTYEGLDAVRRGNIAPYLKDDLVAISRVLVSIGCITKPLAPLGKGALPDPQLRTTVPQDWFTWVQRWYDTSTLAPVTRRHAYYDLLKAGRWLKEHHPDVVSPDQWTREIAAEFVAAVDRMAIGQWMADSSSIDPTLLGKPLAPRTKNGHLAAMRVFFRDCQEWGWIPRHLDPGRSFATPRSIRALIAPDPRVIQDDVWAKLLWAGLNLTAEDLPASMYAFGPIMATRHSWYPLEMLRAMAIVWLFAGLRSDELIRLRLGCIRWQQEDAAIPGTEEVLSKDAVCMLAVPTHKTGTAFTKPVDPAVGEAVTAWEQVRPPQPVLLDRKTSEMVQFLFCYRGYRVGRTYLNDTLIPLLCRKGGVAERDARGDITSHRARSTIATQLFNAKEPLTLFELQEWLGHRSPASTQHYAKITPTKLAKSYEKAGYFGRNLRTIEVLIDQDAVKSGAAATGEPWKFYDLGHGYCLYEFFDACPHRMACAKCAFYRPKGSTQAQLLEGKANLLHMLQEIPLSEEERAAVEDGIEAMEKLCQQLAEVPTPAGPTPHQLIAGSSEAPALIPIEKVRRKR